MSTIKSQKAELVAIYRLEFYKKQSNWKLSSSRKSKTPKKTVVKEKLNATYNVDKEIQKKDLSDPLNVAFVDSDSDRNPKLLKSPNNPELSQEWQEPVNIWPQIRTHNSTIDNFKPALHCTKQRLQNLQKAADLANLENNYIDNDLCSKNTDYTQLPWKDWQQNRNSPTTCGLSPQNLHLGTNIVHSSQNRNKLTNFTIPPQNINPPTNLASEFQTTENIIIPIQNINSTTNVAICPQNVGEGLGWNDCGEFEGNWPMETAIWVGAGHMAPDMFQVEDPDVHDVNTPDLWPSDWPLVAPPDELPWSLDMEGDTTVDSAGEFMRGADGAPHSSEIDLSLPNCVKACDVSFSSLSHLSSQQLVLAARLHSRVLKKLLLESETRQKLRSTKSLSSTDFSYEEFPTRDVCPTGQLQNLLVKDVIIAGSHKNVGEVGRGRGRGRLPNSSFKPFS